MLEAFPLSPDAISGLEKEEWLGEEYLGLVMPVGNVGHASGIRWPLLPSREIRERSVICFHGRRSRSIKTSSDPISRRVVLRK